MASRLPFLASGQKAGLDAGILQQLDEAFVLGERTVEVGTAKIVQVPPLAIEAAVVEKGVGGMAEHDVIDRPHLRKVPERHRTARLHFRQGLRGPHGEYGSTAAEQGNSAKRRISRATAK